MQEHILSFIKLYKSNFDNIMLGYFDIEGYDDQLFVYIKDNTNVPMETLYLFDELVNDTYKIEEDEEASIIAKLDSEDLIHQYADIITECNFNNYDLYSIYMTEENHDIIVNLIKLLKGSKTSEITEHTLEFNPVAIDNHDKLTMYIVLRSDYPSTNIEKACFISELSAKIGCTDEFLYYKDKWDGQIVIVTANYDDLFVNNIIPSQYDNPDIVFEKLVKSERKVAPGNYALDEACVVAVGYFGIKKELPKFIRKLPLWRI